MWKLSLFQEICKAADCVIEHDLQLNSANKWYQHKFIYCAFHKHLNSKVRKPPLQLRFSLPLIIITITSNEPWNTENHKTDRNSPIVDHKPWPFWTRISKVLFPKRSAKIIGGSEKSKRQLVLNVKVRVFFEKCSKVIVNERLQWNPASRSLLYYGHFFGCQVRRPYWFSCRKVSLIWSPVNTAMIFWPIGDRINGHIL